MIKFQDIISDLNEQFLKANGATLCNKEVLIIEKQTFSNETIFDTYLESSMMKEIKFSLFNFKSIDFGSSLFFGCHFDQCIFDDINFRKAEFSKCTFNDCQIINSELLKTAFFINTFTNCTFLKNKLRLVDFYDCQLKELTFRGNDLYWADMEKSKYWKSGKWVSIEKASDSDAIENFLKQINWLIPD